MKNLQIVVEGSSEEAFVNDVLVKHFAALNIFISARKIKTGWNRLNNKPAKGGLLKYSMFKKDILRWIMEDLIHFTLVSLICMHFRQIQEVHIPVKFRT